MSKDRKYIMTIEYEQLETMLKSTCGIIAACGYSDAQLNEMYDKVLNEIYIK